MKQIALIFILLMCGCSTLPKTVEIPIAVPCTVPPEISRPKLAISALKPDSLPAELIKAYEVSLEELGGYARQLEKVLEGYRK